MTGTSISTSTHGQGSSRALARSSAARRSVARGSERSPGRNPASSPASASDRRHRELARRSWGLLAIAQRTEPAALPALRAPRCPFALSLRPDTAEVRRLVEQTPDGRPKRACARCERRRPLPSSSSSPHALAWERASRPKPAMLAVNLVLRAMRVEQNLARSDSRRCRSLGWFQCSEMLPRGSGRWGRKGVRFPAQLTRIVVSPAGDGELPGPGYARAARSVATAARKLAPPAPARDACGPAIVIEMPRRPRRDVARPELGGPGRTGAVWAVAQRSPVGAASSAVETGCPAGMASAPPAVGGSIVWASWPPPTCTRRGLAASATGIVSVSTPCS